MHIDTTYSRPDSSISNADFNAYVEAWADTADLAQSEDRQHLGDLLIEAQRRGDQESIRAIASALVIS